MVDRSLGGPKGGSLRQRLPHVDAPDLCIAAMMTSTSSRLEVYQTNKGSLLQTTRVQQALLIVVPLLETCFMRVMARNQDARFHLLGLSVMQKKQTCRLLCQEKHHLPIARCRLKIL